MQYPAEIQNLPIAPHLDEICAALRSSPSRFLVLTAETAAGKSTAVPLALLRHFAGKILVLEPRRLAAIAIANRVASLLGEEVGGAAGYRLHGENCTSKSTRLEVITQAILTRMLQADPSLDGVSVVVIDEAHERTIHADLALAFLKDAMALRDDLFVVVMSATMDTVRLCEYLGASAFHVEGRQFPVEIAYASRLSAAEAVRAELRRGGSGAILVFLPGLREILQTKVELEGEDAQILVLHSSISFAEQKKVLSPAGSGVRRVILSSSIAETSLTVPDVALVIDSGLSRTVRLDAATGLEKMTTERESSFSAAQRAGRAGRIRAGKCVRLFAETDALPPQSAEIERADLLSLVLECAAWGAREIADLDWLTPPKEAAWANAKSLLQTLGCLAADGTICDKGRAALLLGESVRIACILLEGKAQNRADEAISAVLPYTSYQNRADISRRLKAVKIAGAQGFANLLLAGFPDRIASLTPDFAVYKFPSGRQAALIASEAQKIAAPPAFIIALDADAGSVQGKIRAYSPLDESEARAFLDARASTREVARFEGDERRFVAEEIRAYGEIVLSRRKKEPSLAAFQAAVCRAVREGGAEWLPLSAKSQSLLLRARFLAASSPELRGKLARLPESAEEWLLPFVTEAAVNEQVVFDALSYYLDGGKIAALAPEEIVLANGRRRRLVYEEIGGEIVPVLEIIIQQLFGVKETPRVAGVPVLLRLLSPASRPLQVTRDLAGFWRDTWADVCREMRGRYPKHNWQPQAVL